MNNDGEDVRHDGATTLVRATCETCEGLFEAEAREVEGAYGRRELDYLTTSCQACIELGASPGSCLAGIEATPCGGNLYGRTSPLGARFFECGDCDAHYSVATLRSLLFGRACEEIVKARADLLTERGRLERRPEEALGLILAKARELKVIA